MTNKDIARQLKLMASLMELHGENQFKVRAYSSAVFNIDKAEFLVEEQSTEQLIEKGFSKNMAEKLYTLAHEGTFPELEKYLADTPKGVIEILEIKGIGGKKIGLLWKELGIESMQALLEAAQRGEIAKLKGFAAKTQQLIIDQIEYIRANSNRFHYAQAEPYAQKLEQYLKEDLGFELVSIVGQIRRSLGIVDKIELVVGTNDFQKLRQALNEIPDLTYEESKSGPMIWRGFVTENNMKVEVHFSNEAQFYGNLLNTSASAEHLAFIPENRTVPIRKLALAQTFESEEDIYKEINLPYILPELREGNQEFDWAKENKLPQLVEMEDLKGILHNHSTYSDGKHSLEEMAVHCKALGYEYLGISDHSQSAFYANGLSVERIQKQHEEIDQLNEQLAPFKIFKGIESDILNDGSLDYPDEVLAGFDFIVSSIHSNLKMDEEKATQRLLTAIANPYTTILGHPTGRLLLKREGYPIDHKKVIDACAEHGVVIEINANPWRLDLDWRWANYALEKGVKLSINPDAHEKRGYDDMRFGWLVGRKAGLTKEMTFNALSSEEIGKYFEGRKK